MMTAKEYRVQCEVPTWLVLVWYRASYDAAEVIKVWQCLDEAQAEDLARILRESGCSVTIHRGEVYV